MKNFTEKQSKKIRTGIGITVAVYLSFKYLLPLVVPFLLAGLLAWVLYPCIRYLHYRFPFIKESLWASFLLILIGLILGLSSWILIMKFGSLVGVQLDFYWKYFWNEIEIRVSQLETFLKLSRGSLSLPINQMATDLGESITSYIVPRTLECAKSLARFSAGFFVMVIATVLLIEEKEQLKDRFLDSSFYMETRITLDNLRQTGGTYLKVQALILGITIFICSIGFWILKIEHPIFKGIAIGIFDTLPIFGTGTIFIPWIIILLLKGKILFAIEVGILYLVCYFVRECMENTMMGKSMGITALEFLISVYVGLKLFGGVGFLLGPIGYLIIRLWMKIML